MKKWDTHIIFMYYVCLCRWMVNEVEETTCFCRLSIIIIVIIQKSVFLRNKRKVLGIRWKVIKETVWKVALYTHYISLPSNLFERACLLLLWKVISLFVISHTDMGCLFVAWNKVDSMFVVKCDLQGKHKRKVRVCFCFYTCLLLLLCISQSILLIAHTSFSSRLCVNFWREREQYFCKKK